MNLKLKLEKNNIKFWSREFSQTYFFTYCVVLKKSSFKFQIAISLKYFNTKWERKKLKLKETRKPEGEELRLSPFTFTKCSSKCTPTSEFRRRRWISWTRSSMTPSPSGCRGAPSSSASTRGEPCPLAIKRQYTQQWSQFISIFLYSIS